MTPDQVKLVQQSFSRVVPISDQAAVMFYDRLFEIAPQVKSMFPADMSAGNIDLTCGAISNRRS